MRSLSEEAVGLDCFVFFRQYPTGLLWRDCNIILYDTIIVYYSTLYDMIYDAITYEYNT